MSFPPNFPEATLIIRSILIQSSNQNNTQSKYLNYTDALKNSMDLVDLLITEMIKLDMTYQNINTTYINQSLDVKLVINCSDQYSLPNYDKLITKLEAFLIDEKNKSDYNNIIWKP